MRAPRAVTVGLLATAVAALSACGSDDVSVTPPDASGQAAAVCRSLDPSLPGTVDGTGASPTDPDSPYTAAWGDIVLTCGGTAPSVPDDAQLIDIDDLDWFEESLPQGGSRFSTVGRVATVSVILPANRQPPSTALVDLGASIKAAIPSTGKQ